MLQTSSCASLIKCVSAVSLSLLYSRAVKDSLPTSYKTSMNNVAFTIWFKTNAGDVILSESPTEPSEPSSPAELPLKVLHVVVTLGVVRGLSLRKILQTAQVVELRGESEKINSVWVQHPE